MLTERVQQSYTSTKYYQFATILEHVIDCFHTIVSDETNPYHPPLAWLTRKQPKPPEDELFLDLMDECSRIDRCGTLASQQRRQSTINSNSIQLSSSIRTRLERCPADTRKEIVSRIKDGCAPLFMACRNGLTSVAKYLIEVCGADIEQKGHYEALEDHHIHSVSPIWVGSVSGQLDIVKLLIDRGANVNSLSDTGSTPLRSVCFLCKDDDYNHNIIDDNNVDGQDYLADEMLPSFMQEEQPIEDVYMLIVKSLVENGADIHQSNYSGGTCLINSIHNYKLVEYILDHGADINATDNQSNQTALHYAIQQGRLETVKLLISRGANPFWCANFNDDALQLSCIKGHEKIFEYLIEQFSYSPHRLADAYKLIGSSILEIHYDLAKVRRYWTKSLEIQSSIEVDRQQQLMTTNTDRASGPLHSNVGANNSNLNDSNISVIDDGDDVDLDVECDIRRSIAFGDMEEFRSEAELQALSVEDFRIQSLMISERILGVNHRETIQRLLYRGTFYINSLRPNRCIDLWIYALKLRLDYDSIFHFESIFAAQAITKLFLDLFGQQQRHQIKFCDVYDVLVLLVGKLDECKRHLSWKPSSCLHEDIFDLLLGIIVNLLLALRSIASSADEFAKTNLLIDKIIKVNPKSSSGSSLLHICVSPSLFESDAYRCFAVPLTSQPPAASQQQRQLQQHDNLGSGQLGNARQANSDGNQLNNVDRNHQLVTDNPQQLNAGLNNEAANGNNPVERVIQSRASQSDNGNQPRRRQRQQQQQQQHLERAITETASEGAASEKNKKKFKSPIVDLIETLLIRGLEVDQPMENGLSALQSLCLSAGIRASDKREIIGLLVERGAHVDRRALTPEQAGLIEQALREAGVNPLDYTSLACLAARKVAELKFKFNDEGEKVLVKSLRELVAIH